MRGAVPDLDAAPDSHEHLERRIDGIGLNGPVLVDPAVRLVNNLNVRLPGIDGHSLLATLAADGLAEALGRLAPAEVIVPNATLISSEVVNWTLSDRVRRVDIDVGVAYGSDPRRVIQLLDEVAERHGLVEKAPKPHVLFTEFGDSALTFELRFWLDVTKGNAAQVSSDLRNWSPLGQFKCDNFQVDVLDWKVGALARFYRALITDH